MHDFGDGDVGVAGCLNDKVDMGVHKAEGEQFEIEFGFVVGEDIS